MSELCIRCGLEEASFGPRCNACRLYYQRNGLERPFALIERAQKRRENARWCSVCGSPELHKAGRCQACYIYGRRYGKERPRYMWADDLVCKNCKFPKAAARRDTSGRLRWSRQRCGLCAKYWYREGVERPEHCWGVGSYGWCECGYPADNLFEKIPFCNRCFREAKMGAFTVLR
jgi:hypothetical protein